MKVYVVVVSYAYEGYDVLDKDAKVFRVKEDALSYAHALQKRTPLGDWVVVEMEIE